MNALCPKCLSAERNSWHAVTMVKNSQQQQSYRGYHIYAWWLWEILSWSKKMPFFQDEQGVGSWCMSVSVITRHKKHNKTNGRVSHANTESSILWWGCHAQVFKWLCQLQEPRCFLWCRSKVIRTHLVWQELFIDAVASLDVKKLII